MNKDYWERLKDLLEEALACTSPAEQRAFLDRNCGEHDRALRSELESLLAEHSRMTAAFLEQAPVGHRFLSNQPGEGTLVGAYRLERQLGQGGMGTVYLASRADGAYQKQVAVKLLSVLGASEELARRFLAERQILARLDHPNIARLVDGGTTENGQPYLVMDYVDGIPIDRYCRDRSLTLDQRLELFALVCSAVAYVNEHLVIHRDIKPSNILVTADGTPKLLDFGISKALCPDPDSAGARTLLLWGTPEYASPEVLNGRSVTQASDVYSLGVLLYELLTDRSPYRITSRIVHEMARVICEEEPEPPSRAVTRPNEDDKSVSETAAHTEEQRRRSKSIRGDLDIIVMTALRKRPEQRYQSASELGQDIRRRAEGLPIQGRPQTWTYRTSTFVRRQRAAIGSAGLAIAVLAGAAYEVRQFRNPTTADTVSRRVWAGEADSVSPDGSLLSTSGLGHLTLHNLHTGEDRNLPENDGYTASSVFSRDGRWLAYTVQPNVENPPPMELRVVRVDGSQRRTVFRDGGPSYLTVQDWTDSQHILAASEYDATNLRLISVADGSSREVPIKSQWRGSRVIASPDGRFAAYTAARDGKSEVRIIALASETDVPLLPQPSDDSLLGWAPDGGKLIFRSNRAGLGAYDMWWVPMEDGRSAGLPERIGPSPDIYGQLGVTRQGALFYARSNDSDEVFVADLHPVAGTLSPPTVLSGRYAGTKTAPIWSPLGTSVLFVAAKALHFHDLSGGNDRDMKPDIADLKRVVAWPRDGRILYESGTGSDGKMGLFRIDAETGEARLVVQGRMDDVALSADAETLYTQGGPQSKSVIARNLSTGKERLLLTRPRRADVANLRLRVSPDGKLLAMQLGEGPQGLNSIAAIPITGGEPRVLLQVRNPQRFGVGSLAWSADSRYIYAAQTTGRFSFTDHSEVLKVPVDGGPAVSIRPSIEGIVRHLSLSPDGRRMLYQRHRTLGEIWTLESFLPVSGGSGTGKR